MDKKSYEDLVLENEKLRNEIQANKQEIIARDNEIATAKQEITDLKIEIENQKLEINTLKRYLFGAKRESVPKEEKLVQGIQCSMFGEPENEEVKEQIAEKTEEITVYRKKNSRKKKAGIKKSMLDSIEKETIDVDIEEKDRICPECNSNLTEIGTEVVRQEIEYIPAKIRLINYVRHSYKCTRCGKKDSEKETSTIIKPKVKNALLVHSFATPSLATEVIYKKYYMGVPLYRQEKIWEDIGLVLPRSMMANWCILLTQYYLEPICDLMLKRMKEKCELLHVDETTMQCNKEIGRKASSKSYMWVMVTGELEKLKGVRFEYNQGRSGKVAQNLLKDYKGILITDGYSGYNDVGEINRAECWAHARRYFYESVPLDENKQMIKSSGGYKGVEHIKELFKIENEIADLSVREKEKIRKEKSEPILKEFYEWVDLMSQKIITNEKLKKALTYAINQKENLSKFLQDGRIPLTNSRAERAIRPFAVHRKNWLFTDTVAGAKANAVYYSLIESAKLNKLNIYKYIKYLLEELSQLEGEQTEKDIEKYLPWSKELPEEILNFEGEYKEMEL